MPWLASVRENSDRLLLMKATDKPRGSQWPQTSAGVTGVLFNGQSAEAPLSSGPFSLLAWVVGWLVLPCAWGDYLLFLMLTSKEKDISVLAGRDWLFGHIRSCLDTLFCLMDILKNAFSSTVNCQLRKFLNRTAGWSEFSRALFRYISLWGCKGETCPQCHHEHCYANEIFLI